MSAEIIALRPTDAELERAWQAYDAARLRVEELYAAAPASTSQERLAAVTEAARLHRAFTRLCARAEAER